VSTPQTQTTGRWVRWPRPESNEPDAPNPWVRWNECAAGSTFQGTWGGSFAGKFGTCAKMTLADDREIKFSLPAVLEKRVTDLPVGAVVRLTYMGLQQGKEGRAYHDFDVEVDVTTLEELPF
jgi:hypothetical protein